ncbi:WXG100 family type VII secretion target [Actinoplanes sp. NPDC049596]|uniref:WXG100 family type VII secretion target n=1 Tax=unclassified Actinoplanes TaxID=2626549 RepID=UPI0034211F59
MPIDTRIEGDPDGIRASSQWMKGSLAGGVDDTVSQMKSARADAARGWNGDAGPAFQARMDTASQKADALRTDIETAANSLVTYADELEDAQRGMARTRQMAADAGLTVVDDQIQPPGDGPVVASIPTDGTATAAQVQAYDEGVAASRAHQAKVDAFVLAQKQADGYWSANNAAKAIARNMWDDLYGKAFLQAGDVVNGAVVGGLVAKHRSILKAQSAALLDDSKRLAEHYLKTPGGTPQSKYLIKASWKSYLDADELARRAPKAGARVAGKIPIIGLGITAAGIGYDIHQGKPVGKAVISGVGGAVAAMAAGAAIGTMVPVPVVGTVLGAVGGLAVGLVASGTLDFVYDGLPQGVKDGIENGFSAAGDAIGDAGSAIGDGAKKAWDAIF